MFAFITFIGTGPTVRLEIWRLVAVWADLFIEKHSVLIDQSKRRIGKLCPGNRFTIYCTVMDIVQSMWEPAPV